MARIVLAAMFAIFRSNSISPRRPLIVVDHRLCRRMVARKFDQKTQLKNMDPFKIRRSSAARSSISSLFLNCTTSSTAASTPPARSVRPIGLATWMVVDHPARTVRYDTCPMSSRRADFGKWAERLRRCCNASPCPRVPYPHHPKQWKPRSRLAQSAFVVLLYVVVYLTLYSGWIYIRAAISMNKKKD